MIVRFHKQFERKIKKLHKNEKQQFKERLTLFIQNPYDRLLNNHFLQGKYKDYRSINITGDLRALYKTIDTETIIFVTIDTHINLYS